MPQTHVNSQYSLNFIYLAPIYTAMASRIVEPEPRNQFEGKKKKKKKS